MAKDISFTTSLTQGAFRDLSKQAGQAMSYKNVAPADPLGVTGFDIGAEATAVKIDSGASYWRAAFGNDVPSYLYIPRVRARKGLPFSIDIGGMYAYLPYSNVRLYGFELSKAILEGSAATPALGIRGTYTKLTGVGDLDCQTAGVDATLSKGFVIITPYIGGGAVYINSKATGNLQRLSNLRTEEIWQPRVYAGLKLTPLPLFNITAEAEYEVRPAYSLKVGITF